MTREELKVKVDMGDDWKLPVPQADIVIVGSPEVVSMIKCGIQKAVDNDCSCELIEVSK